MFNPHTHSKGFGFQINAAVIQFLENNILARFGCPDKIITDNAAAFRSKKMVNFCHKFHITLGHSTAYYPQGNGLAESSNKSLINIIKKTLEENKKNWHKKLVNALWADRLTTKRSIETSPYELVYGLEARFPSSLGVPVMKLLQESQKSEKILLCLLSCYQKCLLQMGIVLQTNKVKTAETHNIAQNKKSYKTIFSLFFSQTNSCL